MMTPYDRIIAALIDCDVVTPEWAVVRESGLSITHPVQAED